MTERTIIPWEQVTIANKFMFYKVMTSNTDLCRRFIEHLLHVQIDRIEPPSGEHTMESATDAHGIRLDVYAKGGGRVFDLEMQIADPGNLPERTRYYQGVMDETELGHGEAYETLRDSYIMFICLFDPFGAGLPVYTFRSRCDEKNDLLLGDRTWKVFYNVKGWERVLDAEERAIFRFILDGTARSDFTKDLGEQVRAARKSPQARERYMTLERYGIDIRNIALKEGREEGRAQGSHDAMLKTARAMLQDGQMAEQVAKWTGLSLAEVRALCQPADALQTQKA